MVATPICERCGHRHEIIERCAGKLIEFPGITRLDLPADRILDRAKERGLASVVIAGHTEDGKEFFASSMADGGDALWLLERCKRALLNAGDA